MTAQASFALRGRNPDILTCIANLSNDEVFTPPEFANRMLDTLAESWASSHGGASIWEDPSVTFLDPCTKSGVFLREITSRLTEGLVGKIPDLHKRVDHILTKQVFGIAITRLTSLLARRSLYCSKVANGAHSVARSFADVAGNVAFPLVEHTWDGERCRHCGAGKSVFDRPEGLERHAYAFIHGEDARATLGSLFGGRMQFDVIIGNPPYQLDDGGFGTSATPIYQLFVEQALALEPRYAVFVTPSRWMTGGKGLDKFRERILSDRRMREVVDFPKLYEAFPNVKIRGGISYFVWDGAHDGPCLVQTMWDGNPTGPAVARFLGDYDVLVRRNEAVSILEKVRARAEQTLDTKVSSRKPFGLPSNVRAATSDRGMADPVSLYLNQRTGWIERSDILVNGDWVNDWKVLVTKAQGTSAAIETKFLSRPIIASPGEACSETYLVAGRFTNETLAANYALYLRTRFVRFLISLRKVTQNVTKDVFAFVPDLSADRVWRDEDLYQRYGLTDGEIAFIESQVAEHDDRLPDDVPVEAIADD